MEDNERSNSCKAALAYTYSTWRLHWQIQQETLSPLASSRPALPSPHPPPPPRAHPERAEHAQHEHDAREQDLRERKRPDEALVRVKRVPEVERCSVERRGQGGLRGAMKMQSSGPHSACQSFGPVSMCRGAAHLRSCAALRAPDPDERAHAERDAPEEGKDLVRRLEPAREDDARRGGRGEGERGAEAG